MLCNVLIPFPALSNNIRACSIQNGSNFQVIEKHVPAGRICRKYENLFFTLSYSFLAIWRYLCAKKQHRFHLGEDQFYINTSLPSVQAENAEKQVFFTILQFSMEIWRLCGNV